MRKQFFAVMFSILLILSSASIVSAQEEMEDIVNSISSQFETKEQRFFSIEEFEEYAEENKDDLKFVFIRYFKTNREGADENERMYTTVFRNENNNENIFLFTEKNPSYDSRTDEGVLIIHDNNKEITINFDVESSTLQNINQNTANSDESSNPDNTAPTQESATQTPAPDTTNSGQAEQSKGAEGTSPSDNGGESGAENSGDDTSQNGEDEASEPQPEATTNVLKENGIEWLTDEQKDTLIEFLDKDNLEVVEVHDQIRINNLPLNARIYLRNYHNEGSALGRPSEVEINNLPNEIKYIANFRGVSSGLEDGDQQTSITNTLEALYEVWRNPQNYQSNPDELIDSLFTGFDRELAHQLTQTEKYVNIDEALENNNEQVAQETIKELVAKNPTADRTTLTEVDSALARLTGVEFIDVDTSAKDYQAPARAKDQQAKNIYKDMARLALMGEAENIFEKEASSNTADAGLTDATIDQANSDRIGTLQTTSNFKTKISPKLDEYRKNTFEGESNSQGSSPSKQEQLKTQLTAALEERAATAGGLLDVARHQLLQQSLNPDDDDQGLPTITIDQYNAETLAGMDGLIGSIFPDKDGNTDPATTNYNIITDTLGLAPETTDESDGDDMPDASDADGGNDASEENEEAQPNTNVNLQQSWETILRQAEVDSAKISEIVQTPTGPAYVVELDTGDNKNKDQKQTQTNKVYAVMNEASTGKGANLNVDTWRGVTEFTVAPRDENNEVIENRDRVTVKAATHEQMLAFMEAGILRSQYTKVEGDEGKSTGLNSRGRKIDNPTHLAINEDGIVVDETGQPTGDAIITTATGSTAFNIDSYGSYDFNEEEEEWEFTENPEADSSQALIRNSGKAGEEPIAGAQSCTSGSNGQYQNRCMIGPNGEIYNTETGRQLANVRQAYITRANSNQQQSVIGQGIGDGLFAVAGSGSAFGGREMFIVDPSTGEAREATAQQVAERFNYDGDEFTQRFAEELEEERASGDSESEAASDIIMDRRYTQEIFRSFWHGSSSPIGRAAETKFMQSTRAGQKWQQNVDKLLGNSLFFNPSEWERALCQDVILADGGSSFKVDTPANLEFSRDSNGNRIASKHISASKSIVPIKEMTEFQLNIAKELVKNEQKPQAGLQETGRIYCSTAFEQALMNGQTPKESSCHKDYSKEGRAFEEYTGTIYEYQYILSWFVRAPQSNHQIVYKVCMRKPTDDLCHNARRFYDEGMAAINYPNTDVDSWTLRTASEYDRVSIVYVEGHKDAINQEKPTKSENPDESKAFYQFDRADPTMRQGEMIQPIIFNGQTPTGQFGTFSISMQGTRESQGPLAK